MAYPHKWSPISYKSSAGQRKHTDQRPMLYRWTTPPTKLSTEQCIPPPRHVLQCRDTDPDSWSRSPPKFNHLFTGQSLEIPCKSVRKFLRKVTNRQTNKQTNRQTLHILLGRGRYLLRGRLQVERTGVESLTFFYTLMSGLLLAQFVDAIWFSLLCFSSFDHNHVFFLQ